MTRIVFVYTGITHIKFNIINYRRRQRPDHTRIVFVYTGITYIKFNIINYRRRQRPDHTRIVFVYTGITYIKFNINNCRGRQRPDHFLDCVYLCWYPSPVNRCSVSLLFIQWYSHPVL